MKTQKPGFMSRLRNRKGFSLVEIAIVLVVIGIIIGAVMKGNDLITNSRAKQVTSAVSTWKALAFAYMDRNGRLPGDASRDGVIGVSKALFGAYSSNETAKANSAINEIQTTMQNAPTNPVVIGSLSFWTYFGNAPGLPVATPGTRNVMVICKDKDCTGVFTADELEIIKSIDTALDGSADANKGQFRGSFSTVAPAAPSTDWVVTTVTGFTNYSSSASTGSTAQAWTEAPGYKQAIWAFDRPF